jgi:hypothetical protein
MSLGTFRFLIIDLWRRSLRRRSQKEHDLETDHEADE